MWMPITCPCRLCKGYVDVDEICLMNIIQNNVFQVKTCFMSVIVLIVSEYLHFLS